MRIISQNGMYDIPYENAIIYQTDEHIMYVFGGIDIGQRLASYSTSEKAEKAIEMLRNAYNDYDFCINLTTENILKDYANHNSKEKFAKYAYPYFRFPADEEVKI